jgi:hypothetical protein
MNIYNNLRCGIVWDTEHERPLLQVEKDAIKSAFVEKDLYGYKVGFRMRDGEKRCIYLDSDSTAQVGKRISLKKIRLLRLYRDEYEGIYYRVKILS